MSQRTLAGFLLLGVCAIASTSHAAAGFDCMIEPTQTIEVRSAVGGLIQSISVKRGDRVKKGQVLVELESSAERAAADSARYRAQMEGPEEVAQTKLSYAKKKYTRRRDMAAEKLMSGQDRDDSEGDMKSAEAELTLARENREVAALDATQQESLLNRRTIRAPFSGIVADQLLYAGEVVEPSDPKKPILKLAQLNPLRVHVILPRALFGGIKQGMRADITPELPSVRRVAGTVTIVDSLIDAASGTFAVFLEVLNPQLDVPAGLKCRASFPTLKDAP
jgi:RND family efflux transporter MFP subunit